MKKHSFAGAEIRALRSAITTHWLALMPAVREKGWRKSDLDPMGLVEYFSPLKVKSGYVLRAYERHEPPDSWGMVWAMPESAPFPEPKPGASGKPPKPAGALDDVMKAIEGDGSPSSYMCASLLAREIEQFATLCPTSEWLNCVILGGDPWISANGVGHTLAGQGFAKERVNWRWIGHKPEDWRPSVYLSEATVTVIFHAFSGAGRQRILSFEDRFVRGSYTFSRQEQAVASGPSGFIW